MYEIINLFTQEHGVFQEYFKFEVILVFILIIVILSKSFQSNYVSIIILLTFGLFITNIYVESNNSGIIDNNKEIYIKLETLQEITYKYINFKINLVTNQTVLPDDKLKLFSNNKLDSLYIDSNIIEFLYSIAKLSEYNTPEFYMLLKGTNNILKLRNEIEKFHDANKDYPENINQILESSLQIKVNCLNSIQNFIYKVPKTNIMYKYIDDIIESYNILINKNIAIIHSYHRDYIRKHGINNRTSFYNMDFAKDFDQLSNHPIIPSKSTKGSNQKLIDLYV